MRHTKLIRSIFGKALALSVFTFAAAATSHAFVSDAVLDNIEVASANGETTGTTIGSAFTTGSTALSLSDVIFIQSLTPGGADSFVAGESCFISARNADGTVGTTLFSNFNVQDGASFGNQTEADVNAPFVLLPNTSYYFSVTAPTTTTWTFSTDTSYLSRLGVTIPSSGSEAYKSTTAGGTKTYFTLAQGPQLILIEASATTVPEPSSVALLTLAGAGAFFVVRRARAAKVA